MDLKETDVLGPFINNHWYYTSKARAVARLLSGRNILKILDVGAGSGFFSHKLLSDTSAKEAWCVDISYEHESDARVVEKPVYYRRCVGMIDADLVLLMDVLEHVDDDVGLLREYVSKVPNGARFLISVPAFQFLWSGHDVFLQHKRRYRLSELEKVVREAGLSVKSGTYYFGAVFPIAVVIRLLTRLLSNRDANAKSQLKRHHPFINKILAMMSNAELPFLSVNRLAGLTIFCVAELAKSDT